MARTVAPPETSEPPPARERNVGAGVVVGLLCGGVAIGVAQLVAGIIDPETSPIIAVGGAAIDMTPEWLKSFAIRTFGANDKTVLLAGIGVVLAIVAALVGVAAIRRPLVGYIGLARPRPGRASSRPRRGPTPARSTRCRRCSVRPRAP